MKRIFAITLLAGLSNASLLCAPALASQLREQLGYSAAQAGLFFSMEFMGYVVAGLIGQWLLPRYDWRRIAICSLLGFLAGTIITAFVLDFMAALMVVRALTASCAALMGVICMSSANEEANASRAYGFYIMGQLAFGVIGLAVLPPLFARFGVIAYFAMIAILLLSAAVATSWLAAGKTKHTATQSPIVTAGGAALLLRFPAVLFIYIAIGGIWVFSGDLARTAGLDAVTAGKVLSAATAAGVLGAGAASYFGKTADNLWPLSIGYALLIGGGLLLSNAQGATWFVLAVLAFKFAWTFALPFVFAIIGSLDRDGRLVAELYLLAGIALVVGPSISGYILEATRSQSAMLNMQVLLLAISAASALTLRRAAQARSQATPAR